MTDRELMMERIQNAMQALDRAHDVSSELRNEVNKENLEAFRKQMRDLCGELEMFKKVLDNQALYGQDEIISLFRQVFGAGPTPYRHMSELPSKKE
jgi:hypothetical protein